MKYCEPDAYDAPTDAYFTDMTGLWDLDTDGIYGEHPDDAGSGGVDFAFRSSMCAAYRVTRRT